MSKGQEYFAAYLDCYVKAVTGGREEFFLSFCDVEEELLEGLDVSDFEEYCVIIVNNRDYSEAVRMRNETNVCKVVLLSGEGVKQIDSLKDFNEYPIIAEDRDVLWCCLKMALGLTSISGYAKTFLSAVLENCEVSFYTLMEYLLASIKMSRSPNMASGTMWEDRAGGIKKVLSPEKLNTNLYMLGMWKSRKTGYLNKGETRRIARASKYSVVESRLTKAVMDRKMTGLKIEKTITENLSSGNIEKMFERVFFEEIKDFLKASARNTSSGDTRTAEAEEVLYENSYQCYLLTDSEKKVTDIEAEWMADKEQEASEETQEWAKFRCTEEERESCGEQYRQLMGAIAEMNLEEAIIREIGDKLSSMWQLFLKNWEKLSRSTPICLEAFCVSASGYAQEYLKLLAFVLKENKIRAAVAGTEVIQRMQMLFCQMEGDSVKMPFYHPICVFYYIYVEKMYKFVVRQRDKEERSALKDRIWLAMLQRAGMRFPVEYMTVGGKTYALNHAKVWQSGAVLFEHQDCGIVYSSLNFHTISRQILTYLARHPFLTHIKIAAMDISSLTGIVWLVDRILDFSQQPWCNIGRVEFLILSAREEELKKEMSDLWDNIGTEEMIRFRFCRNVYWHGGQYDMKKLTEETDIVIIADNSMLYHEPRMVAYSNNGFVNRLQKIDLDGQAERYFAQHSDDIAVIWDSLQYAAKNREDGYRIWKNREIDNGILSAINRTVSNCSDKAVILLSSNEHILSDIFRTQYIHAHQGGYSGRNITIIEFAKDNQKTMLPDEGNPMVRYSLMEFYDAMLGVEDFSEFFSEMLEDIYLEFGCQDGEFYCSCQIVKKEEDDSDREWEAQCLEWVQWQIKKLVSHDNVLGIYFRETLLNYLLEQASNLPSVLLLERLFLENFQSVAEEISSLDVIEKDPKWKNRKRTLAGHDCMEALKMHEIMAFVRNKASIDEQTASQFRERYEARLLERLINCNAVYGFLPYETVDKLQKIQERIRA